MFVVDAVVEQQGLALALLGRQADAGADGAAPSPGAGACRRRDRCRRRLAGAEDGLEDLGASGADQAGQPDDLAGRTAKLDVVELAAAGQALDAQDGSASATVPRGREDVLDGAAGHQPDDLGGRGLLGREAGRDRRRP